MDPRKRPALVRAFAELRRRRVVGSVAAYVVLAALIIELSGAIFDALLFPDWSARLVTVLLIIGFPVVVVLSWFFDVSVAGSKPETAGGGDGTKGLGEALRRSRAAPIPDAPTQRRRPVPGPAHREAGPDPERVREAALGHVRHELRTPINGIIGYSEMLLEDVADPGLAADLERIREAGVRLLARVDEVLRPGGAAGSALEDPDAFGETVRADLRTPINAVVGYAEMLVESCQEAGRTELLDDLDRILRSARRLLALLDDIVHLATATGAGSEVLGDASAVTEQVLSRLQPVAPGAGGAEGAGRLLVVDDNETNRDLISRQLARFGYTVATAEDGLDAMERLEREAFDLILLDVIMPRQDGVTTLERLRDAGGLEETPVIMLSSLTELDSAVRCMAMGATDYLTKPIQPALLEARIAAALELRELRSREGAYRRRVESDGSLIDRLLAGAFPRFVRDRVREGAVDVRESYARAAAVRLLYPPALRPGSGPDGLARLESLQATAAAVESLAAEHDVPGLVWRPDGLLAVVPGDGAAADPASEAGPVVAAAELALALRDRVAGAALGVHAGSLVAGVVGAESPRFELWGEAVESAEALALHAGPGQVLVTPAVRTALADLYPTEARGVKEVRGRGQMRVWSLAPAGEAEEVTAG